MRRTPVIRFSEQRGLAAAGLAVAALAAAPATVLAQEPDRTATVSEGTPPIVWSGKTQTGVTGQTTLTPYPGHQSDCDTPNERCDRMLLQVLGEPDRLHVDVSINSGGVPSGFGDDLDLYVFESDPNGRLGRRVAWSENGDSEPERVALKKPRGWYLIHVVWSWAIQSSFNATAAVTGAPAPPQPVADVLPGLSVSLSATSRSLPALLGRGLPVQLACTIACDTEVTLVADRATARRARLRSRLAAHGRASLAEPGVGALRLRPAATVRRRLQRLRTFRGTVTVIATDAAGMRTRASQPVALRRPARR